MSFLRLHIITLLAVLLPAGMFAQTVAPDSGTSLLWEISGKKLKVPSYIYGTVHVIPAEDFIVSPKVQEKMRLAGQLVMERDHSSNPFDGGFEKMMTSMGGMMLTPPQSLRTLVGEEEFPALKRFIKDSLHLDVNMTNAMKPFFVSQQIAQHYCMTGATRSYESYFADQFDRMYKQAIGLETIDLQRQYLDSIPLDVQTREMLNNVSNPRILCEGYDEMIEMYKAGDIEGLYKFAVRGQDAQGYMTILLDHRNAIWIPELEKLMKKNSSFIAVGVAHLGGANGLLQLLRNEGYTVRPIQ